MIRSTMKFVVRTKAWRSSGQRLGLAPVLFVQPEVFETVPVIDAVDHRSVALDIRVPAGAGSVVPQDRPRRILSQLAFDRPDQLLALCGVEFDRLPIDQLVGLRVTIAVVIALATAAEILIEGLVW